MKKSQVFKSLDSINRNGNIISEVTNHLKSHKHIESIILMTTTDKDFHLFTSGSIKDFAHQIGKIEYIKQKLAFIEFSRSMEID